MDLGRSGYSSARVLPRPMGHRLLFSMRAVVQYWRNRQVVMIKTAREG